MKEDLLQKIFNFEATLAEAVEYALVETNAQVFKITPKRGEKVLYSIVIMSADSAEEILPAIQAIEDSWED